MAYVDQVVVSDLEPNFIEIMYLKNIHNEKRGWREKTHNQLFFLRKKLETNRGQHFVVNVKPLFNVDRHYFELKRIQKKQHNHRVDNHDQMKYVEGLAPKLIQYLFFLF